MNAFDLPSPNPLPPTNDVAELHRLKIAAEEAASAWLATNNGSIGAFTVDQRSELERLTWQQRATAAWFEAHPERDAYLASLAAPAKAVRAAKA